MRLGVVGTGMIAKEVLPHLREWGWEAAALCGTPRSRDIISGLCRENGIPASYTDYKEMLYSEQLDAVYLAVPNDLHASFALQALEAGRNVIVEKPLTANFREAQSIAAAARERRLFLFEAVSTLYLPNYWKIKEWLPRIGRIRMANCNFSQYSRRYNAFLAGEILPAFDPAKAGGALMDLNTYNLHYLTGLLGGPEQVRYFANAERGIDTSGALLMEYGDFVAVSIAAKDSSSPSGCLIQGTEGYICQDTPANFCGPVTLCLRDGREERFDGNPSNRLEAEFRFFAGEIASADLKRCYELLDHSLMVSRLQTAARADAGIAFPCDE